LSATQEASDLQRRILGALPKRLDLACVTPAVLAQLHGLWTRSPAVFTELRAAVCDCLLDLTITQARQQTTFYAERFADLNDAVINREGLHRLEVLRREDLEAAGPSIRSRVAEYAFTSYTSGTTRGAPFAVDRSAHEQRYLTQFFSQPDQPARTQGSVALLLATWHHGPRLTLPSQTIGLPVYLANEIGFIQARSLLRREYRVGGEDVRITAVGGTPNRLMQLTAYLHAMGDADAASGVVTLQTSGRYVTRHARDWLSRFWIDAVLVDRYSLAEMFFGASHCAECDRYHFDDFGHAEVTEVGSAGLQPALRGELLLTGLYPFTQMTPLIRYAPGDYADVTPSDACSSHRRGFRFLGRSALPLGSDGGGERFIASSEVYEALDGIPDVARVPNPPYPLEAPKAPMPGWCHAAGALPRFWMRSEHGRPVVVVELRYSPSAFPDRVAAVERQIRVGVKRNCSALRDLDEFVLKLRPPSDSIDRAHQHRP